MADQQAVVALVFDARGAQKGAADTIAASEKIIASAKRMERVFSPISDEADKATRRIVKGTSDQARAFDSLVKKLDPLGESVRRAQRDVDMLSRAFASGGEAANRAAGVWENAQRRLREAQRAATGGAGGSFGGGDMQRAAGDADRAGASFGVFAARAVAVGAAVYAAKRAVEGFVEGIARASDQVNQLNARLNVLTGSAQGSRDTFDAVYQIAQRTGIALADAGNAYGRLAIAAGEFGATNQQVAVVVDTLTKLGRVAGGTTAEVSAGIQQLGQALASGVLQGDELRSIRENLPLVARAIAKEFGVGIGELKRLGEEGQLTADRVFRALQKANAEATAQFAQMPQTVEQAATRSANAMTVVTAEFGKWSGLATFFVDKLNQASTIMEGIARGIGVLNNPEFKDRAERSAIERDLVELRRRQGQPRSFIGDLFGSSPSEINERIAAGEARLRAIDARAADRTYDAGISANEQTFGGMSRAAAATGARRTAAMVEVDKLRATYDPLIKLQRDLAEAKKHYDAAVASGAMTQAHANQELDKYRRHLLAAGAAGKETAKSIEALAEATAAADFSGKLADAAYSGAQALAEIEAQAQAAKKAMDLFGGKRDAAFEGKLTAALMADRQNKAVRDFRESTLGIERENQLLQRQLELIGQRPEIVDREIAALRVKLDLEARGVTMSAQDIRRRVEAVTVQERLTRETEESRRAAEMWAEPFKNAIQGIQSTFTDFFEKVLSGGIRSFGDLANSMKQIWFRLMAELASAAIIRPVIQFAVSGAGSLGLIGPQTMQALGVTGGGMPTTFMGGSGGVGNGVGSNPLSMLGGGGGGGWLSRQLGGIGNWLNTPFGNMSMFGGPSSMVGAGMGAMASSGGAGLGAMGGGMASSGLSGLGAITPMGAIGGIAGIGTGIFSLATGGGSASSLVSGIGSMIGGVVSMIPGVGQILGPIIMIGSQILGGLLKKDPTFAAQGFHKYNPATKRYTGRVGFEENMKAPIAPGLGNDVLKMLGQFGGSVTPGMAPPEYYLWSGFKDGRMDGTITAESSPTYAALLEKVWKSGQINTTDEAQWAARTELWTDSPIDGQWTPLPIHDLTTDSDKLAQQVALLIMKAGVRDGAFTGLSATSQKIIRNYPDADTKGLAEALQWGKQTYDQLIRPDVMGDAEKTIGDLKDTFQAAIMKAEEFRLSTDRLTEAQDRAIKKVATGFNENIADRILGITDPAALQRLQLDREFEKLRKEAEYLNSEAVYSLTGVLININELERAYGLERERIVSQQLEGLMALQKRLLFGDLSGATPAATVAGTQASFRSTLAQAQAGSADALGRLSGVGADYVSSLQAAFGNTERFASGRDEVLRAIEGFMGTGGAVGGAAANLNGGVSTEDRILIQGLFTRVDQQAEQIAALIAELRRAA